MVTAFVLRVVPMLVYINKPCVRDECTYLDLARSILDGEGMVGTHGWLWAPAYPMLMALHGLITGFPASVQVTQLVVAVASVWMLYDLTEGEAGRKAARIAAWLYALNPTFVFYTQSLWSETLYSGLLLAALLALRWAREGGAGRGWLPGLLVGFCVLFRGVATYILPIFVLALMWGRWRSPVAWRGALACVAATVLAVAPYSVYATAKFGGPVIADRTLGQMMWLGNNDFPPMTFDVGNGVLSDKAYNRAVASGRRHCAFLKDPIRQDDCEVAAGKEWIAAHPAQFAARIPERVSQLVNPHSFLTRHLRWGRWKGIPQAVDEVIVVIVVGLSFLTLIGGTIGFFVRGRGWYALAAGLIVLYHVAAIAVLAGLTRYRMPLEPLWTVFAAGMLADPRCSGVAPPGRTRTALAIVVSLALFALMLRFFPAGWTAWRRW